MVALLVLSGRRDVMGDFANRRLTQVGAVAAAVIVLTLNAILLLQTAGIPVPYLG
jgi:manganese transport protein